MFSASVDILEVGILLVRHVAECRIIQRSSFTTLTHAKPDLLLALVLPYESISQHSEQQKFDAICCQQRPNAERIRRRLLLPVEKRTDDISNTRTRSDQIIPRTIIFFDWPPVLLVTSDRDSTNDASYSFGVSVLHQAS
jgi:hypothetical protein